MSKILLILSLISGCLFFLSAFVSVLDDKKRQSISYGLVIYGFLFLFAALSIATALFSN